MTLSSRRKRPTTPSNTAGGTESRSALAQWAGRGALALLAASAGLAGFVVAEELLPETPASQTKDPLERLKNRSAAERVAHLQEQLEQEDADATEDLRDRRREKGSAAVPAGEAVSLDEAARVLDRMGDGLSEIPATPDEEVSLDEAGAVLDSLANEPTRDVRETGGVESPSPAEPTPAEVTVPSDSETIPPVPGDTELEGGVSRLEAARILDQLAEGGPLPELPRPPVVSGRGDTSGSPVTDPPASDENQGSEVPSPEEPVTSSPILDEVLPTAPVVEPTPVDPPASESLRRRSRTVSAMQFPDESTPDVEPVRDPSQLKKLLEIQPYSDYEPDGEVNGVDRCQNLCPRPGDKNCPDCKPGMSDDPNRPGCPECPEEVSLNHGNVSADALARSFPANAYHWEAPNVWHYPLYFEDEQLERYGHSRPWYIQPFFSTARMSGQLLMGPYQMALLPPWRKDYSLGYYRPGKCVPYNYERIPWNARAASVQAGAVVGGYFLFAPTP